MFKRLSIVFLIIIILISGCTNNVPTEIQEDTEQPSTTLPDTDYLDDDFREEITGKFSIETDVDNGYIVTGKTYTITKAGKYTISGRLEEGKVVVSIEEEDSITIVLNGVSITNSTSDPLSIDKADDCKIKITEGKYNEFIDTRPAETTDEDEKGGAIYASVDLSIKGEGRLYIYSSYNNGIHTKKDLELSGLTLKSVAVNNSLKGNDSVRIDSGDITLISKNGDGIKTSDSKISSKGNQRGIVTLNGGKINIYSSRDGIDSSYDVNISEDVELNIFTGKYSEYGDDTNVSAKEMYLVVPSSSYRGYRFSVKFTNENGNIKWENSSFSTMIRSGRTEYYGLKLNIPSGYTSMTVYRFKFSQVDNSENEYSAVSDQLTVNDSMNGFLITDISSKLDGEWVTIVENGGRNEGKNTEKSLDSAKGIKADNEININGGNINISSGDDAIHANNDVKLENESYGLGNINISGGMITIISADDAIHADSTINIDNGTIEIKKSHEGLEANVININEGRIIINAKDDGINAVKGSRSPLFNMTGGYLEVITPSGDTDGIDSNGNITVSGGLILVKGGSSQGRVAGSVDVDGYIRVDGGTFIAFGGICETPSTSSCNTVIFERKQFPQGSYAITGENADDVIVSFELGSSYSSLWISSEFFTLGQQYSIVKDGSNMYSWTMTSGTQRIN